MESKSANVIFQPKMEDILPKEPIAEAMMGDTAMM